MASVILVNTKKVVELEPGKTAHRWWNNADPTNAVWSANAVPLAEVSQDQDVALEITRLWRKQIVGNAGQAPGGTTVEDEIHFEIKNVGTQSALHRVSFCDLVSQLVANPTFP